MTFTPISGQRRLLEKSIKDGGVAGVPTSYYRKALDLNRFSNSVANKLLESYRRQIIKGVRELERIDKMPSSKKPEFKAARTRALIQQNLESMRSWSKQSVTELVKQLDGLADVEVSFAQNELMRAVPAEFKSSVRTVEVTEAFAESVVKADPLDVGTNLLRQNIEEAVKGPGSVLKLTARQGAIIRMPDGSSVVKSFRGLAERQGELFSRAVLDGLLTGEGTEAISRSLFGELGFSTEALTSRQVALAQTGNAWKMAKHQVRTLVRTSVNATSNAASQAVYKANPEVTKQYRWIATLDSRTTAICRNLDQNVYEYGKGPTPASPPHFNCRSTTIPVIDYEGLGIPPPPNTQGYRPTKESKPNSADPDGGRVPVNVSAAQHIYDLRGNTKSGGKARFEPSAAQARMLNGGKDTPGARQKARYYNRLADKYGPDGAMKRFMQQDGSEVSLKQLKQRYGDPDKIERAAAKPKAKPKPIVKKKPKATPAPVAAPKPAASKPATIEKAKQKSEAQAASKKTADLQRQLKEAKQKTAKAKAAATAAKTEAAEAKAKLVVQQKAAKPVSLNKDAERLEQLNKELKALTPELIKAKPSKEVLTKYKKVSLDLKELKAKVQVNADAKASAEGRLNYQKILKEQSKTYKSTKAPTKELEAWSGNDFRKMRAEQFKTAREQGVSLNYYEDFQAFTYDKTPKGLRNKIAKMEGYLEGGPKFEGTVRRGMNMDNNKLEQLVKGIESGNETLAMESWTKNPTLKREFLNGNNNEVILSMKNKRGVDISGDVLAKFKGEGEVLQPAGVKYKIKSQRKEQIDEYKTSQGVYRWLIELEQI